MIQNSTDLVNEIIHIRVTEKAGTVEVRLADRIVYVGDREAYDGEYEVTPKVVSQSLPTEEKYLKKDITVNAIPFFEVSNASGGNTIYIGNEV